MSRIPARLMPAYHAELWVVRGKLHGKLPKTHVATSHSKPNRISRNTVTPSTIGISTQAKKSCCPSSKKTVKKKVHAVAAAHALRNKARKRTRRNRNASERRTSENKLFDK